MPNSPRRKLDEESIPDDCISNLTVDNLIFTLHDSKLKVLLIKYNRGLSINQWGLIGHWVKKDENLVIDYKIHFILKNWKLWEKVFKIKKYRVTWDTNSKEWNIKIIKKHPLKIMSTKRLFPWRHYIEIQINWVNFWKKDFELGL